MKKIFKNHDLFKIIGVAILFTAILTWIIPTGAFSETELVQGEISRIGFVDFFSTFVSSAQFFMHQALFLLVLGGFYGLLTKVKAYQALVEKVTKLLKGHEVVFVLATTFVLAVLASISIGVYQILLVVPFIITVILRLKMDKITAFGATFGAILIGVIGATYSSTDGINYLNEYTGSTFATLIGAKVVIFFLIYAAFSYFNIKHIKSTLNKAEKTEDKFAVEAPTNKKTSIICISVILGILVALQIIGFIGWHNTFNIEIFQNFHEWLMGIQIGDHPIFRYIIGSTGATSAIGEWNLLTLMILMALATIIIATVYKVKFDEVIDSISTGMKKMLKPALIVILVNIVFVLIYNNGHTDIVRTMMNFILNITNSFNVFLMSLNGIITSFFYTDFGYNGWLTGFYFASRFTEQRELIPIVINSIHGLAQFFVPTSLVLMAGLAYLNLEYKTWFKYIWKFLVITFAILLIIFLLLQYVF